MRHEEMGGDPACWSHLFDDPDAGADEEDRSDGDDRDAGAEPDTVADATAPRQSRSQS